jgi:anti-sigma regulatory factor (Ser/Thr protein kinase)
MEVKEERILRIAEASQAGEARRIAVAFASRLGLGEVEAGRVAIVVTEVATNLAKHARDGELLVRAVEEDGVPAIAVLALDRGPGIRDLGRALRDGESTAGSAGNGLGAIARMSAQFDIYSSAAGTVLVAYVADAPNAPRGDARWLALGAVSVPKPGEDVCGDRWAAAAGTSRGTAVVVVDGLGHGPDAAEAAAVGTEVFRRNAGRAPAEILERMHRALQGTRGAAASIAELDRERRVVRFAGVGNVAGAVVAGDTMRAMVTHYGTLGHDVRRITEFTYPWPEGELVVLHSDGLGTRWRVDAYPGLGRRHPMVIAGVLYRDFRRERDDATVVVLREAA